MMMRMHAGRGCSAPMKLAAVIGGLALLAGCATQQDPSTQLQSARSAYQKLEENPEAARSAAEALRRSERELEQAEKLLSEGADMGLVDHHAYLAERYAQIAEAQVRQAELQQEIDRARDRRQKLQIEMERRRAERAQARAEQAREAQAEIKARLSDLQAKETERGLVLTLGDVLFAFDEAQLKPGGERVAQRLSTFLKEYEDRRIRVEGHTDSMGPDAYNEKLSLRRAEAVKQAIVGHGIARSRIVTEGYGEQYPVASNDNAAGRQRNRRVEVLISDQDGNLEGR